jgi:ABC-type antimicrobial peptide transport system permease subunit
MADVDDDENGASLVRDDSTASFCAKLVLSSRYVVTDTWRHKRNFLTGLLTVFIVVFFIAMLVTTVDQSPIIFLKLSETVSGENDVILSPGMGVQNKRIVFPDGLPLINHTHIERSVSRVPTARGASSRWVALATVLNTEDRTLNASATVLGMDTKKEAALGIGRSWRHPPLKSGTCYLSRPIARQIGLDPATAVGVKVTMLIDVFAMARAVDVVDDDGDKGGKVSSSDKKGGSEGGNGDNDADPNDLSGGSGGCGDGACGAANAGDGTPAQLRQVLQAVAPGFWDAEVDLTPFDGINVTHALRSVTQDVVDDNAGSLPSVLPVPDVNALLDRLYEQDRNGALSGVARADIRAALDSVTGLNLTIGDVDALNGLRDGRDVEFDLALPADALNERPEFNVPIITRDHGMLDARASVDKMFARNNLNHSWPLVYGDLLTLFYPLYKNELRFEQNVTIQAVVDEPDGKWPVSFGSVLVMETRDLVAALKAYAHQLFAFNDELVIRPSDIFPQLRKAIKPAADSNVVDLQPVLEQIESALAREMDNPSLGIHIGKPLGLLGVDNATIALIDVVGEQVQNIDPDEFSLLSIVQFRNRIATYLKDLDGMTADIIRYTNAIAGGIGVSYPVTYTVPIALALQQTILIRTFLDTIFGCVIVLLVFLGALLIYALLLNDVEAKTYEYGMLRALGMQHPHLAEILILRALLFAVPGTILGLIGCYFAHIPIADAIAAYASLPPVYALETRAVVIAAIVGIVMPFVANILPIRRALSRTLRDSLDIYHHVISDVNVRVQKLAELGIDLWQTALALLMLVVGIVVFYVIPYAFIFKEIPVFLGILSAVLLGMLMGLCVLAQLMQPSLERIILRFVVWGRHARLRPLVAKNLVGHRNRNKKTAQMFTICLAFVIFAGVMFTLQARTVADTLKVFFGADLVVTAPTMKDRLRVANMSAHLDEAKAQRAAGVAHAVVEDYTYITFNLDWNSVVWSARFSNLPGFPQMKNPVYAVQRNYLNVVYRDFYAATEVSGGKDTSTDVIALMYDDGGNARLPDEVNERMLVPAAALSGRIYPDIGDMALFDDDGARKNFTALAETAAAAATAVDNEPPRTSMEKAYLDYVDVLVSEAHRSYTSVTTSTPLAIRMRAYRQSEGRVNRYHYMCKARGMLSKLPGFIYSSYRITATFASVLMREDSYMRLLNDAAEYAQIRPLTETPMQRLLIRVADDATPDDIADVVNNLRAFFRSDDVLVVDTRAMVESARAAVSLLNIFFLLIGSIAMIMCFFIVWMSFSANVTENAWEFGVLRAVGINASQVVYVYVYEALTIVLSSCILGSLIGITVAATLTLQLNLFTEMPFTLELPTTLISTMLSLALVGAVFGSALPARAFVKASISEVLRST